MNFAKQESIKEEKTSDLSDKKVTVQKNVPSFKRTNEEKVKSDQLRFRSRKIVGPNDLRYRLNWKRKGDASTLFKTHKSQKKNVLGYCDTFLRSTIWYL